MRHDFTAGTGYLYRSIRCRTRTQCARSASGCMSVLFLYGPYHHSLFGLFFFIVSQLLASEVSSDRFCILPVEASGLYPFA